MHYIPSETLHIVLVLHVNIILTLHIVFMCVLNFVSATLSIGTVRILEILHY